MLYNQLCVYNARGLIRLYISLIYFDVFLTDSFMVNRCVNNNTKIKNTIKIIFIIF